MNNNPRFTIAICTKDRAKILELNIKILLTSLEKVRTNSVEILVIDSSKTTDTKKIMKLLSGKSRISINYFSSGKEGIASQRNMAIEKSRGRFLIFIDDDITVSENWFQNATSAVSKFPNAVFIGGKILSQKPIPERFKYVHALKEKKNLWPLAISDSGNRILKFPQKFNLETATLVINKNLLVRDVGLFDPSFGNLKSFPKIWGGEDMELVYRAGRLNCEMAYYPQLVTFHQIPARKLSRKFLRWRYYEHGKEMANLERIYFSKTKVYKQIWGRLKETLLCFRRSVSQYIFGRDDNFRYEARLCFIIGYFYASMIYLMWNANNR